MKIDQFRFEFDLGACLGTCVFNPPPATEAWTATIVAQSDPLIQYVATAEFKTKAMWLAVGQWLGLGHVETEANLKPTVGGIHKHGRWWWFMDTLTMKVAQPVLVSLRDKYSQTSEISFEHPWPQVGAERQHWVGGVSDQIFQWFGPCH